MNRREALKTAAIVVMTTTVASAYTDKQIVNRTKMKIADPAHPTKAELKHTPDIIVGSKDASGYTLVEVTVGKEGIIHPSKPDHWIYEIELYADGKLVDRVSLEPVISRGYLGSRVKLDGIKHLRAIAKCNLHGEWESILTLGS
ncbi:MAG: twin-arginine translocation pathway signal protein [Sulfurovum sp.]|nr:MAG: twin-arginine translocation pathway signal protein [Sulfurovum sp.]